MSRPTTRVLAVLELLQARRRISGRALAEQIGVDERTLRRYIVLLEELGIPITSERGRHGGYGLIAGYKLPPMMFNDEEAVALSLGLLAAAGLGLNETVPAAASARAKLERVMPPALQRRLHATSEATALELPRGESTGDLAALAVLSGAAQSRQRVQLGYATARGEASTRTFDPYALAWRSGRWYAVGHCHLRKDLRSFRLDRIRCVQPLPESFARPERFDALAHMTRAVASLPRTHTISVQLRCALNEARRELHPGLGLLEADGERTLLHAQADDLDWFARELARLPFAFAVLKPIELRQALRACAKRLQQMADAEGWDVAESRPP